jgi:hypothetical protein
MFAVVHLANGVELLLKSRLLAEHWALLFEKEASREKYLSGDFVSVSAESCISRLDKIVELTLGDECIRALASLREARNRLVHFSADESISLRVVALSALSRFMHFVHTECDLALEDQRRLERVGARLVELKEYVAKRKMAVGEEVAQNATKLYFCPRCRERTLLCPDARCLVCCHQFYHLSDVMEHHVAVVSDGSPRLGVNYGRCPACMEPFAVQFEAGAPLVRCMSCEHAFDPTAVQACRGCDDWYAGAESGLCDPCRDEPDLGDGLIEVPVGG